MKIGVFQIALRLLACVLVLFPHYALAGTVGIPGFYGGRTMTPPPGTLPKLKPNGVVQGAVVPDPVKNTLTIQQTQQNAIIDWKSFDIGSDASVIFNQQGNASWSALNRIWDSNPSQIFGNLTADGKIYLINQNGILFGRSSRVNVNSLVASALNIKDGDFLNNILQFNHEDYIKDPSNPLDPLVAVSNHGEINAANGGYVFLMAPNVENYGVINAPTGQIGLVAGTDVTLQSPSDQNTSRSAYYVLIHDDFTNPPHYGTAVNGSEMGVKGQLNADGGLVGMYGYNVEQNGVIRSITAYKNKKGQVELRAANQVTTGAGSEIDLPVNRSTDTVDDTFDIQPVVDIGGLFKTDPGVSDNIGYWAAADANMIVLGGAIIAPTAQVTLNAVKQVTMQSGSSIDVSGAAADLPAATITGKLTSTELRDAYQQKTGLVPGLTITTTPQAGSSIGNISDWILTQPRTALERSIGGALKKGPDGTYTQQKGTIAVTVSDGDIVVNDGAVIDISGGRINYASGFVNTTKLLSGNRVYDISNAPQDLHYDKVLGNYEKVYSRFGVVEKYTNYGLQPKTYVQGYTKGGDAGTLTLQAKTVVLDGTLNGGVTRGSYQIASTLPGSFLTDADYGTAKVLSVARGLEAPTAGTLSIITAGAAGSIFIREDKQDSTFDHALQTGDTVLSATTLNNAKLNTINLTADLSISTAPDAVINLQPGGGFSAEARRIVHKGKITVSAGAISLVASQNDTSLLGQGGLFTTDNPNPNYKDIAGGERIVLAGGSRLDVSGEIRDNRQSDSTYTGRAFGGSIELKDKTDMGSGVFIQSGAVVDVSGGYTIDGKGKVTGGNAGTLSIQGANIMLDGDLRGHALADPNGKLLGGSVTLASREIHVAANGDNWSGFDPMSIDKNNDVPTSMKGVLTLAGNRFDDTGFSQITLNSIGNLSIDTAISPSRVRLNNPSSSTLSEQSAYGSAVSSRPDLNLITLYPDMAFMAGPSSISAEAGKVFEGASSNFYNNLILPVNDVSTITVSENATVSTAPAVSSVARLTGTATNPAAVKTGINLTAPNIDIRGTLRSEGGGITAKATRGDLTIEHGAIISVQGYNRPDPSSTPKGFPLNHRPVDGGSVTLTATTDSGFGGNLTLAGGSTIDVAGSEPVTTTLSTANGSYYSFIEASNPGSLSLNYFNNNGLHWNDAAKVDASHAKIDGLQGGTLSITSTNVGGELAVGAEDFARYKNSGFDDISLISRGSLKFSGAINETVNRKLTLDAVVIKSDGGSDETLIAPWIVLTNTYRPLSSLDNLAKKDISPPSGNLALSGTWIDVIGAVSFIDVNAGTANGFSNVTLQAKRDIRLSEAYYYTGDQSKGLSGKLSTAGNLVLDADRVYGGNFYQFDTSTSAYKTTIYPNLYSDYDVHAYGTVTIMHSQQTDHMDSPIYSAGSNLKIRGDEGIDVMSGAHVAAPLGTITLSVLDGHQIHLADNSTLTVAGDDRFAVLYNSVSDNNKWIEDQSKSINPNGDPVPFDRLPQKGITLDGGAAGKIIVDQNAVIDVRDGGSVFSYKFQPGLAGSNDPLAKSGRYVVFKADEYPMPGKTVWLKGGGGLSEGLYTLLPLDPNNSQNERYAFMPGAYILELQSGTTIPGAMSVTKEGYALTTGYTGVAGTQIQSARPQVYSVRKADDVRNEGDFVLPDPLKADQAGDIAISGNTVILNGKVWTGNGGGKVSLGASNITVQQVATNAETDGNLYVSVDFLSNKNFSEIDLGNADQTNNMTSSITIDKDVQLNASAIVLTATQGADSNGKSTASIAVYSGAGLTSTSGDVTLATPGKLTIDSGATVHAKNNITLDVNDVTGISMGNLKSDSGSLKLKSRTIFLGNDTTKTDAGLYLTQDTWNNKLKGFSNITLQAAGYTDTTGYHSDIQFRDNFGLTATNSLTLDAARIVGLNSGGTNVTVSAPTVNIRNSGAATDDSATTNRGGTFAVGNADSTNTVSQINVGHGDVLLSGFNAIALNSNNDVTFKGAGSLATGGADLKIRARRITTGADTKTDGTYEAPRFKVVAGLTKNDLNPAGLITLTSNGQADTTATSGGTLEFAARKIDVATVIQVDGGDVKLTTSGARNADGTAFKPFADGTNGSFSDGIVLRDGGKILANGTDSAPGGRVTLATDFIDATGAVVSGQSGKIELQNGSLIDVSAGGQGDAGLISLSAPVNGVSIQGDLKGNAGQSGKGGSFVLDSNSIDIAGLNAKLMAGGFTEALKLRARNGDVIVNSADTINAHFVKLVADSGAIDVEGGIHSDAEGTAGGVVELYAKNDMTVNGSIRAVSVASKSADQNVLLSSTQGPINMNGSIDVSDSKGINNYGVVYLRAKRNAANDNINATLGATGSIKGQSAVYAEAFQTYDPTQLTGALGDAATFYGNYAGNTSPNRFGNSISNFHLLPGIELSSAGNINWITAWDQHNDTTGNTLTRFGNEPGVLTLRTGGDLNITQNIVDHPTLISNLNSNSAQPSWGFNLVAGADTSSADFMAVNKGKGNLNIVDGKLVYTESAPIRFASGNDTVIGQVQDGTANLMPGYMIDPTMGYNLANYSGNIHGNVGRDLIINGGAIQTATGDINITVGRDIQLNQASIPTADKTGYYNLLGSIRTTGETSGSNISQYWTYARGGDITVDVGRSVGTGDSSSSPNAAPYSWDQFYMDNNGYLKSGSWRSYSVAVTNNSNEVHFTYNGQDYKAVIPLTCTGTSCNYSSSAFAPLLQTALNNAQDSAATGRTFAATGGTFAVTKIVDKGQEYLSISFNSPSKTDAVNIFTDGSTLTYSSLKFSSNNLAVPYNSPYGLWAASYTRGAGMKLLNGSTANNDVTSGMATMGGGNLSVRTGGDFRAQAGTFGGAYCSSFGGAYCQNTNGDLMIYAGGDITGRFLNAHGNAEMNAMGNFGAPINSATGIDNRVQIELFDSRMTVAARGEMQIGAIVNPTMVSDQSLSQNNLYRGCTYTPDTSIKLKAGGDVTLYGETPVYSQNSHSDISDMLRVLPASVNIDAGGNIDFRQGFTLTSSPTGNLRLVAGGDIKEDLSITGTTATVAKGILMSDIAPSEWYGYFKIASQNAANVSWSNGTSYNYHGSGESGTKALHAVLDGDPDSVKALKEQPIVVSAGGDIVDLGLYAPKKAEVTAERDIINMMYEGQNISPEDASRIFAGRDIQMKYVKQETNQTTGQLQGSKTGFIQGGPGVFLVQAGGSIDLGSANNITDAAGAIISYGGIQTIGSGNNVLLGAGKSTLVVLSGYSQSLPADTIRTFFDELRDAGDLYSTLMAGKAKQDDLNSLVDRMASRDITIPQNITDSEKKLWTALLDTANGETTFINNLKASAEKDGVTLYQKITSGSDAQDATALLSSTKAQLIKQFLGGPSQNGAGNIDMVSSQIGASVGQSDIFVIANGTINLGRTALPISSAVSPPTTGIWTGGGGGVNVFAKQDINVNESRIMTYYGGDITVWSDDGSINAGRGSRTAVSATPPRKQTDPATKQTTLIFTPPAVGSGIRAVTYGENPPDPGNIHLFAPSGIIDAGEAGIAGGKIILGALQVNNAANIIFSAGSIGVPQAKEGSVNIGAMTGAGLAQGSQLSGDASGIAAARTQTSQMIDDIMAKWLDVKFVDFVVDQ